MDDRDPSENSVANSFQYEVEYSPDSSAEEVLAKAIEYEKSYYDKVWIKAFTDVVHPQPRTYAFAKANQEQNFFNPSSNKNLAGFFAGFITVQDPSYDLINLNNECFVKVRETVESKFPVGLNIVISGYRVSEVEQERGLKYSTNERSFPVFISMKKDNGSNKS